MTIATGRTTETRCRRAMRRRTGSGRAPFFMPETKERNEWRKAMDAIEKRMVECRSG